MALRFCATSWTRSRASHRQQVRERCLRALSNRAQKRRRSVDDCLEHRSVPTAGGVRDADGGSHCRAQKRAAGQGLRRGLLSGRDRSAKRCEAPQGGPASSRGHHQRSGEARAGVSGSAAGLAVECGGPRSQSCERFRRASSYLAPLAGRGRNPRGNARIPVEGQRAAPAMSGLYNWKQAPHPSPLPASGARELSTGFGRALARFARHNTRTRAARRGRGEAGRPSVPSRRASRAA
jgi:hypothetical protein